MKFQFKLILLYQIALLRNNANTEYPPSDSPDWSEDAKTGSHIWVQTSASGDSCCVEDNECSKDGPLFQCSACRIIAHLNCLSNVKPACKPTFIYSGMEQQNTHHHWVQRRNEKGKCKVCGKSFHTMLNKIFSSKESISVSCAWCKSSFHVETCFNLDQIGEDCSLGTLAKVIVPPSWIIKHPRKDIAGKTKPEAEELPMFEIKPIPSARTTPVLVFLNPHSGGNQGVKLLEEFQWLLNPRQVFDLKLGFGPKFGLELYRNVPNLRILVCGGDGTAGWVLSALDEMEFKNPPAVGVLPLGTGNDLARVLNWGGKYNGKSVESILSSISESDIVRLDRWSLKVTANPTAKDDNQDGKSKLPLNVVNNYFSIGVDADIALEFHEAREKNKEKFDSLLYNKWVYSKAGGKEMMNPQWKNFSDLISVDCDGKDLTPKLKEHRVHAVLFLNIPSYGGGSHPWDDSATEYKHQAMDDGLIEVVGLTTSQLLLIRMREGSGTCIAQCRAAKIVTSKTIPMQVDGEPVKLEPSSIELTLLNKALMLSKKERIKHNPLICHS